MRRSDSILRAALAIGLTVLLLGGPLARRGRVLAASAHDPEFGRALVLLKPGSDTDRTLRVIRQSGGRVTHLFPSIAFIGEVPVTSDPVTGTLAVHRQSLSEAALAALSPEARDAANVWNALLASETGPNLLENRETLAEELVNDALTPPAESELRSAASDVTPGYRETSEYLIGRVAVGIILPESDGSAEPSAEDWTADERALVLSEITAALDWWAAREPNARLEFVYDDGMTATIGTAYEPITHGLGEQGLWISDVMENKGYASYSYFDQVRQYNNHMRDTYGTDWAFTVFVVDSSNDSDNRFADGYFAYAYLGGRSWL